ncbi:hypothetical protein [Flavobacterium sp. HSC-61S13]|uniref:hypothetical protein n=1 Tax=Flavobacterium sp. HSC-61S13 TaxID=2910963 RepID=UPI00209F8997|nr:hypothetical protein [Flavobacterium sp. HSC-61S13]MCP1995664.1 antitoxin component YwqK of YwqJK toxin-antitoxin module [Flavobacterium sp. HSC-61S13]
MKKNIYIPFLLLAGATMHAQNDTIWTNYSDQVVGKTDAMYYKTIRPLKDKTFEVSKYTKTHILYSKGISSTDENPSIYQGNLRVFDQKGSLLNTFEYKDGVINGTVISTLNDGTTYQAVFNENELYSGTVVYEYEDVYTAMEAKDGMIIKAELFAKTPQNYRQVVYFENNLPVKEETFDGKGQLIATCTYSGYEIYNGNHIDFYYSPLQLKSNSEHKDGSLVKKTQYYRTGEIKEVQVLKDQVNSFTQYNRNGEVIAVYQEQTEADSYTTINDGTQILYNSEIGKEDLMEFKYVYKDSSLSELYEYSSEGTLKQLTEYNDYYPTKVTYYDKNGHKESELIYNESGSPQDGVEKLENIHRVYSNGNLVSETLFYSNGAPFKKYASFKATYFDKKGKQIGQAAFDSKENYNYYSTPTDGVLISIDDKDLINESNTYKNAKLISSITFENYKGKAAKVQEINYDENEYKISEIKYHSNGQILSESRYANYEVIHSTFYDDKGKLLGKFDHVKLDGTLYTFFDSTNEIQSISKYKNANLLYKKTFYKADIIFAENSKTYLESEIDYYKEGLFYEKGVLVSKTVYKDGKPFQGKTIIRDDYSSKVITNYENGLKEGEEVTYSVYLDDITTRDFYHLGEQISTELYENNVVVARIPMENGYYHGEAIYFDSEGQEASRLTYKEGVYYDGVLIANLGSDSSETSTYKEGVLVESKTISEGQVRMTRTLLNEEELLYHVQNFTASGVLRYDFKMRDDNIDGEIVYYNEKGKAQNKAQLSDGKLISGTIALKVQDYNYETSNHILVTKKGTKYTTKVYSDENETLLYESTIKMIDKGEQHNPLPISIPITIESLYPTLVDFGQYYF